MFELSKILCFVQATLLPSRQCRAMPCRACMCSQRTQLRGTQPLPRPCKRCSGTGHTRGWCHRQQGWTRPHTNAWCFLPKFKCTVCGAVFATPGGRKPGWSRSCKAFARFSGCGGVRRGCQVGQIRRGFITADRSTADGTGVVLLLNQFKSFFPFWYVDSSQDDF